MMMRGPPPLTSWFALASTCLNQIANEGEQSGEQERQWRYARGNWRADEKKPETKILRY